MNSNLRKRVVALGMVCVLSAGSGTALADPVLVTDSAAVYASADNSSKLLGTLEPGVLLNQVAERNGWSKVTLKGHVGYMATSALADVVEFSHSKTGYTLKSTPMYKSFNKDSRKLGTIPENAKVSVQAIAGDWARVRYRGYTGFVDLASLTPNAPSKPNGDLNLTVYACVDGAKVYNSKGRVVNTVPLNTQVIVHKVKDGICLVEKDGIKAFMMKNELSETKTAVPEEDEVVTITPAVFYVKNQGAKVYDFKGNVICPLDQNTTVTVDAYKGDLARVRRGKYVGVMYRSDLSSHKIEAENENDGVVHIEPTTFYVQNDGAKVVDKDGNEITTLSLNTAVTVTAYNDDLAMISSGFSIGFMKKSDLAAEKVPEPKPEPEAKPDDGITEIDPTTFYVQKDGAKVVDKDGNEITTLSLNAAVTVVAYSENLAKVTSGSHVGFMKKSDLGPSKVETEPEKDPTLEYGDKGEEVKKLQTRLRELGYFHGTIGGNYLNLTRSAVSAFQTAAKLPVTGTADKDTLKAMFSDDAPKYEPPKEESGSAATPAHGTAKTMDWWKSGIQNIFPRGGIATVTDVETGISWREKRSGGYNHADCQPLTAADTAAMKKAVGGHWSWDRRAIFVTINGVNYAASMNCMNHGSGSIKDNGFDGHHCIHFTNSRTHGSNRVCKLHQAAIKKAANATL